MDTHKVIVFTGHRDKITTDLELAHILFGFPDHIWRHGGAKGFDTQVSMFASLNGIEQQVFRPDYEHFGKKFAPLKRNMDMLNLGDVELVVACYDGRDHGGTLFTMQYAYKCNIEVLIVEAIGGT